MIESLPERPLSPEETVAFRDAEAIEGMVQMERAPGIVDSIILLVRGTIWALHFEQDGWTATKLGECPDPELFAATVAEILVDEGYSVSPAEDNW